MKKIILLTFFALANLFLCGCGEYIIINGVSYRVLSEDEERAMLSFARMTLLNSGEKMTAQQKNFIRTQTPKIRISYTGDKSGRASYEWIFNDEILFRLNCDGEFLTDSMAVNARKVNLVENLKKGEKSNLEKLTLKEMDFDKK